MEFFVSHEASEKIDKIVRAKKDFHGIPANTCGTVVRVLSVDLKGDQCALEIKWQTGSRRKSVSWLFSKTGYHELLEEIDMTQR